MLSYRFQGLETSQFIIPNFDVNKDSAVCLHFPKEITYDNPDLHQSFTFLKNDENSDCHLHIKSQLIGFWTLDPIPFSQTPKPINFLKRIYRCFKHPKIKEIILAKLKCFDDPCIEFLKENNIDENIRYDYYATDERMLICLYIAMRLNELILFTTAGLSLEGRKKIINYIEKNIQNKSAIHFSFELKDGARTCIGRDNCHKIAYKP